MKSKNRRKIFPHFLHTKLLLFFIKIKYKFFNHLMWCFMKRGQCCEPEWIFQFHLFVLEMLTVFVQVQIIFLWMGFLIWLECWVFELFGLFFWGSLVHTVSWKYRVYDYSFRHDFAKWSPSQTHQAK
jgi:hypothetical protein